MAYGQAVLWLTNNRGRVLFEAIQRGPDVFDWTARGQANVGEPWAAVLANAAECARYHKSAVAGGPWAQTFREAYIASRRR